MNDDNLNRIDNSEEKEKLVPSQKEWQIILQILSLERENNTSSKKYSQQEIVNKILGIIRKEVENENN